MTPTQLSVIRESEQQFLIGVGVHAHASWEVNSNQAWKTDQLPAVLTELVHSKSEFLVNRLLRMIFAAITNLEMRVKERLSALPYSLFIVCDRRQSLDKRIQRHIVNSCLIFTLFSRLRAVVSVSAQA